MINKSFKKRVLALPDGAYDVFYNDKRYGLTKSTHLGGKLFKLYAKELGGNDFISLNYYPYLRDGLKPCEMPQEKVIDFVLGLIKD
ncbi:MAG TPA: peptide methionine sulfoxide reductase [Campylobacterales bacterium]|nr:peptide methionine sulfoxide reductase [Campylobacterales bacterium]